MTRLLSVLAATAAVVVASLGLAACSKSPGTHPRPSPRPRPSASASSTGSPSSTASPSPNITTVVLAVATLPTTFGVPGAATSYPASLRVSLPASLSEQVAAYGVAGTVVLAPAGWTGSGAVGADGSAAFTLYPTGSAPGVGAEIVYQFDGACAGCTWGDASAYFPAVAQALPSTGTGTAASPPAGLQTESLASGLIGYSLPDSAAGLQLNGVAYTNLPASTAMPVFENLLVTLPTSEHPLATLILNAFVANEDRYVCHSAASSPTISLTLANGTC